MKKKVKFKPVITRIKLNPEQAILVCPCYNTLYMAGSGIKKTICSGTTPANKTTTTNTKSASGGTFS